MPIYEFYCPNCHTIFNFFSLKVNIDKRPKCPQCGRPNLERKFSLFSVSKGLQEEDDQMPDFDEKKMEKAMQMMGKEADKLDEENPQQAAQLMRKLYEATGLEMGEGMKEAMSRLESGEDLDQIEQDLGDVLEDDLIKNPKKTIQRKFMPPAEDQTIYDL